MKRMIATLLLLSLCLLCFGCSQSSAEPQIRYEKANAYYTQEGAQYTMEIQFAEPVAKGSTLSLLLEDKEILGFTAEATFTNLHLSSPALELEKPYVLTVNGELQRHGKGRPIVQATEPGYIPDPTISTIPQEPMGDTTVSDEKVESDTSLDTPPIVSIDISPEYLVPVGGSDPVTESPALNPDGTLVSKPGIGDKVQTDNIALKPNIQFGGTTFTLSGTVTRFISVQNAS